MCNKNKDIFRQRIVALKEARKLLTRVIAFLMLHKPIKKLLDVANSYTNKWWKPKVGILSMSIGSIQRGKQSLWK